MLLTTGELAKACHVSVRTVQYYDKKGILSPVDMSEGGRRLYDKQSLQRLQVICYLRDMDFSIKDIQALLADSDNLKIVALLLESHVKKLKDDIEEKKSQIDKSVNLIKELSVLEKYTDSPFKLALQSSKERQDYRRFYMTFICLGFLLQLFFWSFLYLSVKGHHIIWLLPIIVSFFVGIGLLIMFFIRKISYICSSCHQIFKPHFIAFFLARHTPRTRLLTCPNCHVKNNCIEVIDSEEI